MIASIEKSDHEMRARTAPSSQRRRGRRRLFLELFPRVVCHGIKAGAEGMEMMRPVDGLGCRMGVCGKAS